MAKKGPAALTKAHKDALATGRKESAAVKAYLEALEQAKPRRGRHTAIRCPGCRRPPPSGTEWLLGMGKDKNFIDPFLTCLVFSGHEEVLGL